MPDAAPDRQLSGYELLGDRIGKGRFTLAQPLGCVFYYCEQQGLPPLTVLVVTKHGRPGSGSPDDRSDPAGRAARTGLLIRVGSVIPVDIPEFTRIRE